MQIDERVVQSAWEKGRVMPGRDPRQWPQDECGAWLRRDQYDNADSEYGWRIVKVMPDAGNDPDGLQPFHCDNTFDIANGRPQGRVTADREGLAPDQRVDRPRNTGA